MGVPSTARRPHRRLRSVAREPDESRVYHLKSKPAAASPPIARARPARAAPELTPLVR